MTAMNDRLTESTLPRALADLGRLDTDLALAHGRVGDPPLRRRPPGFATLLRIILAQQVSTASARAILARLDQAASPLDPETFLALDDGQLRAIGFSRRKTDYGRGLARDVAEGRLDLERLKDLDDEEAMAQLVTVKGIGRWTAEIYLMFALGRPDIWPAADLGLAQAVHRLKDLKERPNREHMMELAQAWRPWRSAAALLLWHFLHET